MQFEACLNSCPLTPLSTDKSDVTPFTPGHFFIGEALVAKPQIDFSSTNPAKLSRFERSTQLIQHFLQRWPKEYLSLLQEVGMLDHILSLYPGADGITRAATVATAKSTVTRAARRLCVLPNE